MQSMYLQLTQVEKKLMRESQLGRGGGFLPEDHDSSLSSMGDGDIQPAHSETSQQWTSFYHP